MQVFPLNVLNGTDDKYSKCALQQCATLEGFVSVWLLKDG